MRDFNLYGGITITDKLEAKTPTEEEIDAKIREIDAEVDLVMITDHLAKSLVLMANRYCIDLHQVSSMAINGRKPEEKVCPKLFIVTEKNMQTPLTGMDAFP